MKSFPALFLFIIGTFLHTEAARWSSFQGYMIDQLRNDPSNLEMIQTVLSASAEAVKNMLNLNALTKENFFNAVRTIATKMMEMGNAETLTNNLFRAAATVDQPQGQQDALKAFEETVFRSNRKLLHHVKDLDPYFYPQYGAPVVDTKDLGRVTEFDQLRHKFQDLMPQTPAIIAFSTISALATIMFFIIVSTVKTTKSKALLGFLGTAIAATSSILSIYMSSIPNPSAVGIMVFVSFVQLCLLMAPSVIKKFKGDDNQLEQNPTTSSMQPQIQHNLEIDLSQESDQKLPEMDLTECCICTSRTEYYMGNICCNARIHPGCLKEYVSKKKKPVKCPSGCGKVLPKDYLRRITKAPFVNQIDDPDAPWDEAHRCKICSGFASGKLPCCSSYMHNQCIEWVADQLLDDGANTMDCPQCCSKISREGERTYKVGDKNVKGTFLITDRGDGDDGAGSSNMKEVEMKNFK